MKEVDKILQPEWCDTDSKIISNTDEDNLF